MLILKGLKNNLQKSPLLFFLFCFVLENETNKRRGVFAICFRPFNISSFSTSQQSSFSKSS